ncbi:MAG: response regulator transcription factor [Alphaproteobacteria bacterium]|nr:response regulator transcription factor [Alphaproteobacteria bacterium]
MNILIVEDEPIAAEKLKGMLARVAPNAAIVGVTGSISETVEWFSENPMADVVMMDINLADGSCFAIFDVVDVTAPIIFCTAYDEYALKAFQSNGIAYLLKPVVESDLTGALEKLEGLRESLSGVEEQRTMLRSMSAGQGGYKNRFLIRAGEKLLPVPVQDVHCFLAHEQGVRLVLSDGDGFFLDYTMAELEGLLDPAQFFRISRQAIVAGDAIVSATANLRQTRVVLDCLREELPVARERAKAFRAWLEG